MSLKTFSCRVLCKLVNHEVVASKKHAQCTRCSSWLSGTELRARLLQQRQGQPTRPGQGGPCPGCGPPQRHEKTRLLTSCRKLQLRCFKWSALFVPTGTMSNLIAVMVHCRERGDEMIVGNLSHLHIYEQGGSAQLAGVHATTTPTTPAHASYVENTHNIQGGRVLPLTFLQEVRALADRYGLSVHMDGARVMNAAVAMGLPPSTILQHTHTVSVCLSKGSGFPGGNHAGWTKDFITRAVRCRKALGGACGWYPCSSWKNCLY
ncbi:hypothetical protein KUCAC02_027561 [Chaenocephalus aceratus]|uniref:Uncharacterized protein n=1 Tax=Chaenocephalus aceratus TaxID=36190 RepID=A0ACB9W4D2_CHAAC|nr:hypothetical protein KUCAC02_027561 [Chaenocephalus aceratus]